MQAVNLYKRLSQRYVDTYRHLDEFEFLCSAKETPPKMVKAPESFDEGGIFTRFVTVPAGASKRDVEDIKQALRDSYSHHGCHHEYDCCGCQSVTARVTRTGRNRYMVRTAVHFNY